MALPIVLQNALRPSPLITWYEQGTTTPVDLTGATITALINRDGTIAAADGTFVITDAANGVFRWDLDAADVADAGSFDVQFNAAYSSGVTPGKTFTAKFVVEASLVAS